MFKIKIRLLFLFIKLYEIVMEFNSRHSKVNKLNNAAMFPQKIFVPLKCLLHHPRNLTIKTFAYRCISRHQCVYILKRVNHVRSGLFWFGNILFVFFVLVGVAWKVNASNDLAQGLEPQDIHFVQRVISLLNANIFGKLNNVYFSIMLYT